MIRLMTIAAIATMLAACSDQNNTQKDPIDSTPPPTQGQNTAPTDRSATPQGGTGGDSQTTSPTGTTNR
ncbi:hypothetical protein ACQKKX_00235 [Neorhizobium sp. NPDC001467]|uniref:hypothetical protein n=1 Tax=Neorhizobium sp. NPDC001467 TaxID=3390595 RepID=UPI003D036D95